MPKERVVYFLGAGFSAPLGLPVMSNFLEKSKDLYFLDPNQYKYFEDVLETISKMSVVKNYYSTDLFNIEEILSILAMQQSLKGKRLKQSFLRYIADVINHYTPVFTPNTDGWGQGWQSAVFGPAGRLGRFFGCFVANVLKLRMSASNPNIAPLRASRFQDAQAEYSIVTLNYDLVLERFAQYVSESFTDEGFLSFHRIPAAKSEKFDSGVPLVKLHGSADTGVIVAPTWNKTLTQNFLPAWKSAFDQLSKANHIRIIGYSLPVADAYIKYLLRAAVIEAPHLKRIDVLCRDDRKSSVRARYGEFIDFANFRFVEGDVADYLRVVDQETIKEIKNFPWHKSMDFRQLEQVHDAFFAQRAG